MRIFVQLISVCFILFSCESNGDSQYRRLLKKSIPKALQHHLPSEIDVDIFSLTFNLKPINEKFEAEPTLVFVEYNTTNIDSIITSLKSRNIESFKYEDKCNMIILKYQSGIGSSGYIGKEWLYKNWINSLDSCSSLNGPIPNFVQVGKGDFEYKNGISPDFELYLTESKRGVHFEESFYKGKHLLPNEWEHGYSKGVALNTNSNDVIHWLIIW